MATYVCEPVPPYVNNLCNENEEGRIRSLIFLKQGVTIADPSNASQWAALEASGDALIMREIRGSTDGGVAVEAPGFGDQVTRIQSTNYTATITDPKIIENIRSGFYDALKRNSYKYKVWYTTETQVWKTNGVPTFSPTIPIQEDLATEVYVVSTVKWKDSNMPFPYDKPGSFLDTIDA